MIQRESSVTDQYGRPVPGATIYVYSQDDTNTVLTSDGVTPLAQPVVSDEFGIYSYFADAAVLREDTYFGGRLRYREEYTLGSPSADLNLRSDIAATTGAALIGLADSTNLAANLLRGRRLTYGTRTRVAELRNARTAAANIHTLVVGYAAQAGITGGNGRPEFIVAIDGMDPTIGGFSEGVGVGTYAWCLAQAQIAGGRIVFDPRGEFDLIIRDSVQNRFNVGAQNISVVAPGRNVTFWHVSLTGSTVVQSFNTIFAYINFRTLPGPLSGDYDGSGNKAEIGLCSVSPTHIDKLAFIGCLFDSASDGALDMAGTAFTSASPIVYVTIQDCLFRSTDEVSLFGSISDTTTTADARRMFVTVDNCTYDGCGQRQPKALGLAMVDMVGCYTQTHPWRRDQPAPIAEFGSCHGASVQNGGWLLARGCLWTALDGVAHEATKLVPNPVSLVDGALRVVDCAAENGMTFATAGAVADPAYIATLPHTPVPAAGAAREAWIAARWLAAGAAVDPAPNGLFTYNPASTDYPNQLTVVKRRVNGTFLAGNEVRVDPQTEVPLDPGPGDGETFDATARGYSRTVGFTEGKTSLAAIGATMLDFANFDSSYHGIVGNGGPATVKHIIFSDGSEPADGLHWWPQGSSSVPVTLVNSTAANVTATAATDIIAHAAHGEATTGFPVVLTNTGGALPAPLIAVKRYYAIRIDANSYKLAATYPDAIAGTAIDLTDAGTGTHTATIGSFNLPNGADVVLNSSSKVGGFIFNTANLRFSVISRPGLQKADVSDLPTLDSGTFVPTLTAVANCSALTAVKAQYLRNGNIVNWSAIITGTQTAASTLTKVGFSLPVASNLAITGDLLGSCVTTGAAPISGALFGDAANDRAEADWVCSAAAGAGFALIVHGQYEVK